MSCPSKAVVAVVLAAGRGRRFGSDKRIARLGDGQGLLATTVARAQPHFAQLYVALREDDEPQALGLPGHTRVICCADADQGMGTSLAVAITQVAALNSQASAIAVLLGDMPWLEDQTLLRLVQAAGSSRIVFPMYKGERGHPVIFGRKYWPQLQGLKGEQGARAILHEHAHACVVLDVEDPAVLLDVDCPQALR
ncbi:nucleotidyltransferase family protein [Pseudomonas segetis]